MQTLVVANFKTGLETGQQPYLLNNDAFPVLQNAYVWRGSVYKKRGRSFLGRPYSTLTAATFSGASNGSGVFSGNIFTNTGIATPNASLVPGSISIDLGAVTFTDPLQDGTLSPNGSINYATGDIVITNAAAPATSPVGTFNFYTNLPIMGIEDFYRTSAGTFAQKGIPETIIFDTIFSYSTNNAFPPVFSQINKYKATGAGFQWTGQDYQQFYTTNYQSSMWVTNGEPGFHFVELTDVAVVASTSATFTTSAAHGLSVGDYVFIYEVPTGPVTGINGVSAAITATPATDTFTILVPTVAGAGGAITGIAQTLTRTKASTNGIKWFDGNPTSTATGWVNFMPPLDNAGLTGGQSQYLIGAKLIVPFKNRLLFFGPTIATSTTPGGQFYPNRVIYSQVGLPYYASPLPVAFPSNTVPQPAAYFTNVAGRGGFLDAPIPDQIVSVEQNLDVLICGFETLPMRLIYTGDDSLPFIYQTISSELGTQSTFSAIPLDTGVVSMGEYGLSLVTQVSAQRIDLKIPDQIFDVGTLQNGLERVSAFRDFRNEFLYFSYPEKKDEDKNVDGQKFNNKVLLYNYRNDTWAIFKESFTKYGNYRISSGLTWSQLGRIYKTWSGWNARWNFGAPSQNYPNVIGGNQQGFLMILGDDIDEDPSFYIKSITITPPVDPDYDTPTVTIESPDHNLEDTDYVYIDGALGVENINGLIFSIDVVDDDTFNLQLVGSQADEDNWPTGTYLGLGVYAKLNNFKIATKQFPLYWGDRRKTRVGTQRFLMDETTNGEITINVYVNQSDISSSSSIVSSYPAFTNTLLTRPEPNMPAQETQEEIWHRVSNSFNGDTVQFELTQSDAQMRDLNIVNSDVVFNAMVLELYPGPLLS